ncbi:uncharacterized protein LOC144049935 [Vanacampus margaritifer]
MSSIATWRTTKGFPARAASSQVMSRQADECQPLIMNGSQLRVSTATGCSGSFERLRTRNGTDVLYPPTHSTLCRLLSRKPKRQKCNKFIFHNAGPPWAKRHSELPIPVGIEKKQLDKA